MPGPETDIPGQATSDSQSAFHFLGRNSRRLNDPVHVLLGVGVRDGPATVNSITLEQGVSHVRLYSFIVHGYEVWGVTLLGENEDVVLAGLDAGERVALDPVAAVIYLKQDRTVQNHE